MNITKSYYRIILIAVILMLIFSANSFSKDRIVIKLNKKATPELLNSFSFNNFSKPGYEILSILNSSNATNSKKLFELKNTSSFKELSDFGFDRIYTFEVDSNTSASMIIRLSKDEYVEYIQKLGKLTLNSLPNDPYLSYQ